MDKRVKKLTAKRCCICGEDAYELLDVHRLIPGASGGRYVEGNTIVVCCRDHRLIHAGKIEVLGRYFSTSGNWMLHYRDESGTEKFATID